MSGVGFGPKNGCPWLRLRLNQSRNRDRELWTAVGNNRSDRLTIIFAGVARTAARLPSVSSLPLGLLNLPDIAFGVPPIAFRVGCKSEVKCFRVRYLPAPAKQTGFHRQDRLARRNDPGTAICPRLKSRSLLAPEVGDIHRRPRDGPATSSRL
jgi:hypothetical protein